MMISMHWNNKLKSNIGRRYTSILEILDILVNDYIATNDFLLRNNYEEFIWSQVSRSLADDAIFKVKFSYSIVIDEKKIRSMYCS